MDTEYDAAATTGATRPTKSATSATIFEISNDIVFTGEIDDRTAHNLNFALRKKEADILQAVKDAKQKHRLKSIDVDAPLYTTTIRIRPKPIRLFLSTRGGVIHSAFTVVDTILALKVPVHTIVQGYVASAGTLISLAGKKRFITPNSYMMVHELRGSAWGRFSEVRDDMSNMTMLMNHLVRFYIKYTTMPETVIREALTHDVKWTAAECIERGLVHELTHDTDDSASE